VKNLRVWKRGRCRLSGGTITTTANTATATTAIVQVALVGVVALLAAPTPARADGILTGFGGVTFGADTAERVGTWGLSLGGMAGGVFGFEIDFGRTTKAETDAVFVTDSQTSTLSGNLLVGIPLGAVRPYVVGGLGWVRTEADAADGSTGRNDGLGVNVGGGLMGFFGEHVGARVDLRYFRSVSSGDNFFDFEFEKLNFTRFTGGVILRF